MNINEATDILKDHGFILEGMKGTPYSEQGLKDLFIEYGWKCLETYERSGGVHFVFKMKDTAVDVFVKGERYECDYYNVGEKKPFKHTTNDFNTIEDLFIKVVFGQ